MEIFTAEPDGRAREQRKLMGRRGYVAIVAYDPEVVTGAFGGGGSQVGSTTGGGTNKESDGTGRLSLAVDFMIQSDPAPGAAGGGGAPTLSGLGGGGGGGAAAGMPAVGKYGPVIVPSLEFGR